MLIGIEIVLRLLIIEERDLNKRLSKSHGNGDSDRSRTFGEESPLLFPEASHEAASDPPKAVHRNVFLTLLSSTRFVVGMFGFCLLNALMIAFDGVLPIFIKENYGFNSQQTSLTFLALTIPMLLSPIFGELTDRLESTKWPAVCALALCVPGLLLLRLIGGKGNDDLGFLIALLLEIGLSFAIGFPPFAAEVMLVVDAMEKENPGVFGPNGAAAQAYGLTNAGLGIGCILGPMGMGFIRVRFGWDVAVTSMAVASALAAAIVLPITGGPLKWSRDKSEQAVEQTHLAGSA